MQVYVVVGIAAVAFTGFLLMLVILKFGGNSKFGIKGKTASCPVVRLDPLCEKGVVARFLAAAGGLPA